MIGGGAIALSLTTATLGQRINDPDFFEQGRDRLETEIDRLNQPEPESVLRSRPDSVWLVVTSAPGGFRVAVPSPVTPQDPISLDLPSGAIAVAGAIANHDDTEYVFAFGDYATPTATPADRLTELRDYMVADTDWAIAQDQSMPLGAFPGRRFVLFSPQQMITYRFYLVGTRLYILGVLQAPERDRTAEIERFFASFTVDFSP
jgi:hypothetical protein